jgi:dCMP deaminase
MVGGTLYLVGMSPDGEVVEGTEPCLLCKRVIVNAGIRYVVVMRPDGTAQRFAVEDWVAGENLARDNDQDPVGSTQ